MFHLILYYPPKSFYHIKLFDVEQYLRKISYQ